MDPRTITDPSFLKNLTIKELEALSGDIRAFLIEQLSKTGGHFSSNMGIVELTIAMHKVFDSPRDKFIFDVGHQSYVHKILTGRAAQFDTLRQADGLSGFLKRSESPHDAYEAGHSSTSIGAAAGMIFAKDHTDSIGQVIAVIGDGALNSGTALEALNFLGHFPDKHPIIVLNDNEMSITQNVGHLSRMLTKLRMKNTYRSLRRKTSKLVPKKFKGFTTKVEKRIKGFIAGSNYLEAIGYEYFGPLDGHDFKSLLRALTTAQTLERPVVVHVRTKKGKGYKFSEADVAGKWHGCKPFEIENGAFNGSGDSRESYSEIVASNLMVRAANDEAFYVVTPAMVAGSALNAFRDAYPRRCIDTGIAESTSALFSGALSMQGVKVFLTIYSTFLQRAYDQIIHDIARHKAPVVIGVERAGLVGGDGETHQGIYDIPMLAHIPFMQIAHPKNSAELQALMDYAFDVNTGPIALRYPRAKTTLNGECEVISSPSWEKVHSGTRGTIIAFGDFIEPLKAAIEDENLDYTLINARFIKPLDEAMLAAIDLEKPLLIHEESTLNGGLGSMILSHYAKKGAVVKQVKLLGFDDAFVPQGARTIMLERYGLDVASIMKAMAEMTHAT